MERKGHLFRRLLPVASAILASGLLLATFAQSSYAGDCYGARSDHRAGDLFPSYWAPPGPNGISAPLYVSPVPTPPVVGHVWVTYQPLYPHEFLYKHNKVYWRNNPQGGRTRVVVGWY